MDQVTKLSGYDKYKQIVCAEIPLESLITQRCGCILKRVEGIEWTYPTFYAVHLCPDRRNCVLKHRVIGRRVWNFYDQFDDIDMEASFGMSQEEAQALLDEWTKE